MTNETLEKAKELQDKIKSLSKLHYIANQDYKKFCTRKKELYVSD